MCGAAQAALLPAPSEPATLGIWGTNAGGIFVGRAATSAPELFAAAIFDVSVLDAVRAEASVNGHHQHQRVRHGEERR